MSLIGGIAAARRHAVAWFGGLALSAQAGIVITAFVTMSAGVAIGAPYTPSFAPWLMPIVAPYRTAQTPSPLKPSVVEAATPNDASPSRRTSAKPTGTTIQPTSAPTTSPVAKTGTRVASTMAPTTATPQAKKASKATTAPQTTSSVYYKNCAAASKAGAAPITIGQPGYRTGLDPKGKGVAC